MMNTAAEVWGRTYTGCLAAALAISPWFEFLHIRVTLCRLQYCRGTGQSLICSGIEARDLLSRMRSGRCESRDKQEFPFPVVVGMFVKIRITLGSHLLFFGLGVKPVPIFPSRFDVIWHSLFFHVQPCHSITEIRAHCHYQAQARVRGHSGEKAPHLLSVPAWVHHYWSPCTPRPHTHG